MYHSNAAQIQIVRVKSYHDREFLFHSADQESYHSYGDEVTTMKVEKQVIELAKTTMITSKHEAIEDDESVVCAIFIFNKLHIRY